MLRWCGTCFWIVSCFAVVVVADPNLCRYHIVVRYILHTTRSFSLQDSSYIIAYVDPSSQMLMCIILNDLYTLDVLCGGFALESGFSTEKRERDAYPVLLGVVLDGAVGAELAHLRGGTDALLDPSRAVLVRLVDERQRLDVYTRMSARERHNHI